MTVMKHFGRVVGLSLGRVFFYFRLTFTFQLLDKLCSQASSLLPSGTCLQFSSRISFSIPTARRFSSNVANSRSRASASIFFARKIPQEYVHSVRIELAKLILVGTTITYAYQATGDPDCTVDRQTTSSTI